MSVPLVGRLLRWLERVPRYRRPVGRERTIEDGLEASERLVLVIFSDFEQLGGTWPSHTRVASRIGRTRRQVITIVNTLKVLGLLQIVSEAPRRPTIYRVVIPDGEADFTRKTRALVKRPHVPSEMNARVGEAGFTPTGSELIRQNGVCYAGKGKRCECRVGGVQCAECSRRRRIETFGPRDEIERTALKAAV